MVFPRLEKQSGQDNGQGCKAKCHRLDAVQGNYSSIGCLKGDHNDGVNAERRDSRFMADTP